MQGGKYMSDFVNEVSFVLEDEKLKQLAADPKMARLGKDLLYIIFSLSDINIFL